MKHNSDYGSYSLTGTLYLDSEASQLLMTLSDIGTVTEIRFLMNIPKRLRSLIYSATSISPY